VGLGKHLSQLSPRVKRNIPEIHWQMLPPKTGYASVQGSKQQMVVGGEHYKKEKQREDREVETSKGLPRS